MSTIKTGVLSGFLIKESWERRWEQREDQDGQEGIIQVPCQGDELPPAPAVDALLSSVSPP